MASNPTSTPIWLTIARDERIATTLESFLEANEDGFREIEIVTMRAALGAGLPFGGGGGAGVDWRISPRHRSLRVVPK